MEKNNTLIEKLSEITKQKISLESSEFNNSKFFDSVRNNVEKPNLEIFFGDNLGVIKLVFTEEYREHHIKVQYMNKKIKIIDTSLPYNPLQDVEYNSLEAIYNAFSNYIKQLENYLYELDKIAEFCTVVDPVKPTYKDEYRKVVIADGVWVHIEVKLDGGVTNVHLIGGDTSWREKLHSGLPKWDHDVMIYRNIMQIFDLESFPDAQGTESSEQHHMQPECGICLCSELANSGPPRPICSNPKCGIYYHRCCLYQWLVACSGHRPQHAVRGTCPNCLAPVSVEPQD